MDKKSERGKDAKACGDTDIGIQDYGAGGKREQLNGLWSTTTITGGSVMQRLAANNYCKDDKGKEDMLKTMLDEHDTHGPPLLNTSKPTRVF